MQVGFARARTAVSLALVVPAVALVVVAACDSSDSSSSSGGFDGGNTCGDFAPCFDGSTTKPDSATPGDDGGPSDAAVVDADPWADADTNCATYADTASQGSVTLRVRNLKNTPLYLGSPVANCKFDVGFELHDQADASQTVALQDQNRCTDFESNPVCPTSTCYPPTVTKIGPDGGYHDIGWPATVFAPRYMAKSCYADAGCATGPCMQEKIAPAGNVRITTYPGFYCDGGACFDCTNGGLVSCLVFGSVGGTTGTPVVTNVSYDGGSGTYQIDIGP